jgi:triacylglycerol lipase
MRHAFLCKTEYPVILVHGIAYRDDIPFLSYWGRVPQKLTRLGAKVFLGNNEGWGSYIKNSGLLKKRIMEIIDMTKSEKVHIIAHSKGGVDARYMISMMDMGDRVASLTTLSTPHGGSYIADIVVNKLIKDNKVYSVLMDMYGRIIGDKSPDSNKVIRELTTEHMRQFNKEVTDCPNVYYQSYGAELKRGSNDPMFYFSYKLLYEQEGPNDGMVSIESSKWGVYRGIFKGKKKNKGLSHLDIIDFKRRTISGVDIPSLYITIVKELKEKGL